jgi:tetratricopeptide (TPR) repeat protein
VEGHGEIFALVDQLARSMLAHLPQTAGTRFSGVAAATTSSLPALKAYLAGETELRAGRYGGAADAFTHALVEDSTFALAAYRRAVAAEWLKDAALEGESITRAVRHRDRLPERDRLLVEAYEAGHLGRVDEAERLIRTVLRAHPRDPVAWERVGELLVHYNPMRGRPMGEARHAFEQALALDPGDREPLWHLAQLAAMEGRAALVDALSASFGTHWEAVTVKLIAAHMRHDTVTVSRLREELRLAPDDVVFRAANVVALYLSAVDESLGLASLLGAGGRHARWRSAGHLLTAHGHLAAGRWRAARGALRAVEALDTGAGMPYLGMFAALPFLPLAEAELRSIRDQLDAWDAAGPSPAAAQHPYVAVDDRSGPRCGSTRSGC